MDYILSKISYYSGLLAILLTWFLVVFPFFFAKRSKKGEILLTFSDVASLPKYKLLMNTVITMIGVFQLIFLNYLKSKYFWDDFGIILYFTGLLSLIVCALFDKKSFPIIHLIFTRIYIVAMTCALLILSSLTGVIGTVTILVTFIGNLIFGIFKKLAYAEIWLISGLSLWGLLVYKCFNKRSCLKLGF